MLVSIALVTLLPVFVLSSEHISLLQDIKRSVERFKAKRPSFFADEKVCYPDIGCFSAKEGPLKHLEILPDSPDKIGTKFFAFTHSQTTATEVNPHDPNSLELIPTAEPLAIIIHGFGNSVNTEQLLSVKDSLLKFGKLNTVIVVDWSKGAKQPDYVEAARNTEVVGYEVAFFVDTLRQKRNIDPKNVHLIGFSLGAQVSGFAGKFSQTTYKWTLGRISALDSAAPLFEDYPGSFLNQNDATFVDAIHSSAGHDLLKGEIGFVHPIGHVDFFPHNGTSQPRCSGIEHVLELSCNHYSSVFYFEASLSGMSDKCEFTAYKCPNYTDFEAKKCATGGDSRLGFYSIGQPGRGVHYLDVLAKYPFCEN